MLIFDLNCIIFEYTIEPSTIIPINLDKIDQNNLSINRNDIELLEKTLIKNKFKFIMFEKDFNL